MSRAVSIVLSFVFLALLAVTGYYIYTVYYIGIDPLQKNVHPLPPVTGPYKVLFNTIDTPYNLVYNSQQEQTNSTPTAASALIRNKSIKYSSGFTLTKRNNSIWFKAGNAFCPVDGNDATAGIDLYSIYAVSHTGWATYVILTDGVTWGQSLANTCVSLNQYKAKGTNKNLAAVKAECTSKGCLGFNYNSVSGDYELFADLSLGQNGFTTR